MFITNRKLKCNLTHSIFSQIRTGANVRSSPSSEEPKAGSSHSVNQEARVEVNNGNNSNGTGPTTSSPHSQALLSSETSPGASSSEVGSSSTGIPVNEQDEVRKRRLQKFSHQTDQ